MPDTQIKAGIPTAKVIKRFVAKETFFSDELNSQYVKGMAYSLREGNDKLAALLPKWIEQGKVEA